MAKGAGISKRERRTTHGGNRSDAEWYGAARW